MPRPVLILALLAWLACPARAVFLKSQMERIDHEPLFDSEYFLDLLSFSYPASWEEDWKASTGPAYRINGASLDCCDLLLQQELKFRKSLSEGLSFRFRLVQQEDKDRQDLHHWLELDQRLGMGFSAQAFGEPAFRKEDADIGFGLAWQGGGLRAGARRNFVDFNFNERGSTNQRYSLKPQTDELSLEFAPGEHRLEASLELDHPLRREVPAENRVFSFRRTTLSLGWRQAPAGGWARSLRYGYEFQKKGDLFNPDPSIASLESRRQVHRLLASAEGSLGPRDRLEAGGLFLSRAARADNAHDSSAGFFHRRWELEPYARWRRKARDWLETELAGFLALGENRQRSASGGPSLYEGVVEAKLGAGLEFLFGASGRIGLYGNFDLDRPDKTWDGGSVRALFLF